MTFSAPVSPRELFEILATVGDQNGVEEVLGSVDWRGVRPRQIYLGVLGRLPEDAQIAQMANCYSAQAHALDAICSPEFQEDIIERILIAYADKRRLIFIHIPKCAGSDLTATLSSRYPCLHENLSRQIWTDRQTFLTSVCDVVKRAAESDSLFIAGHIPLDWFVVRKLCRFADRIFTIIRDPFDVAMSSVNYFFRRLQEDPDCQDPDTKEWAQALEIRQFRHDWPAETIKALALTACHTPEIVRQNCLCNHLGKGDAASALDMLFRCDVEITDTLRYRQWRYDRWGVDSTSSLNASPPILTRDMLTPADLDFLHEHLAEDVKLFEKLESELQRSGKSSIQGSDLML